MKHFILLVAAVLVGSYSFASMQTIGQNHSGYYALGSAFKAPAMAQAPKQAGDITMVYAGQDVSTSAMSGGTFVA